MAKETTRMEVIYETTKIPSFPDKKVYVLPGAFYGSVVTMFAEAGFGKASTVEEADLVCFIGGTDIDPAIYNQKAIPGTQRPDMARDKFECDTYKKCLELKKPMFGICRGAQLLHALNDGQLWQHVDNHAGGDHWIYDLDEDYYVLANSMHHQMIMSDGSTDLEIIACCKDQISKVFKSADVILKLAEDNANGGPPLTEVEVEAGYYTETRCLFVQGHPEVSSPQYRAWCLNKLKEFMRLWDLTKAPSSTPVEDQMETWRRAALM